MIKAVIFDVGGVLHASKIKYVEADIRKTLNITEKIFKKTNAKLVPLLQKGKINEKEYWKRYLTLSGSISSLPKKSLFLREYVKRFKPHKKVLQISKDLKNNGFKIALLSNTIPAHTNYKKAMGTYDNFDVKVFSYKVRFIKPDPKIYRLTLRKLKIKPQEAVFIDDKLENVRAANKLGIKGIHFKNENKLYKDLQKLKVLY